MSRDYERPIIPPEWKDAWFTFARMTVEALDELHEPIKEKDLVKALQEKIDNATPTPTPDTGWVSQTINSGFTSSTFVKARRIGDIICVKGLIQTSSILNSDASKVVCTLDQQFRPHEVTRFPIGAVGNGSNPSRYWVVDITAAGVLTEYNYSGVDVQKSNRFIMTYMAD